MKLCNFKRRGYIIVLCLIVTLLVIEGYTIIIKDAGTTTNLRSIASSLFSLDEYRVPPALPPIYANASEVEQKTQLRDAYSNLSEGVVTFLAPDEVTKVQSFYQAYMRKVGWDFGFDTTNAASSSVTGYFQYESFDSPRYAVKISLHRVTARSTLVSIQMFAGGSDWHGSTLYELNQVTPTMTR